MKCNNSFSIFLLSGSLTYSLTRARPAAALTAFCRASALGMPQTQKGTSQKGKDAARNHEKFIVNVK